VRDSVFPQWLEPSLEPCPTSPPSLEPPVRPESHIGAAYRKGVETPRQPPKEISNMAKQQSSKKRTQVKDLPRKDKKLSAGDMKKVKGGKSEVSIETIEIVKKPIPIK
jgi:hypothetical protein